MSLSSPETETVCEFESPAFAAPFNSVAAAIAVVAATSAVFVVDCVDFGATYVVAGFEAGAIFGETTGREIVTGRETVAGREITTAASA